MADPLTRAFDVLPAIDLRGGRVVRLQQGDFERETVFSVDPVAVALAFVDAGARWLHVVDLDGARSGASGHAQVIGAIVDAIGSSGSVEVAGGLRSAAVVADALAAGATRAVIGTAAVADPAFAGGLVRRHGPERIAVAVDVRDGLAVGHGWTPGTPGVDAITVLRDLVAVGVTTFEVTAIDRDGLLGGPDLELYQRVVAIAGASVIASAGIASVSDLEAVRAIGCTGAIVGRALYDGRLDLRAAIAALQ